MQINALVGFGVVGVGVVGVAAGMLVAQPVDVSDGHPIRPYGTYEPLRASMVLTDGSEDHQDRGFADSVAISDGVLYVSSPGAVFAFDERTGGLHWVYQRGNPGSWGVDGDPIDVGGGLLATPTPFQPQDAPGIELVDVKSLDGVAVLVPDSGTVGSVNGIRLHGERALFTVSPGWGGNGVAGEAYLFDLGSGEELARFESDWIPVSDIRTEALGLDDEILVLGDLEVPDPGDPNSAFGRVRVFDAQSFEHLYTLVPDEFTEGFGSAVAMNDSYIAVAQSRGPRTDWGGHVGTVDLFDKQSGGFVWRFTPLDTEQMWGNAIAMNERFVCVLSVWSDAAYLIEIDDPERVYRLANPDGHWIGGAAVAMNERTLVIGDGERAALVYRLDCPADLNGDEAFRADDISLFLGWYAAADPRADLTGDGLINFLDVRRFLDDGRAACL